MFFQVSRTQEALWGSGSPTKIFALVDYICVPIIKGIGETFFSPKMRIFSKFFPRKNPNSFITFSGHDVYKRIRTDSISSMSSMLSFASSIPESIESTDSRYRHLKRRKNAETRPSEKHKVLDFSKSFQPQTLVCAKCVT